MMPRTKRPRRAHTQAREDILRAAARLFVKKGYEATTMQDIVRAAETSIGNVYFYFANKEALAWTLLEEAATSSWEWTDDAVATVPPGPARLAVMVMANATNLLGINAGLTRIVLLGATTRTLRERVAEKFALRIREYIVANAASFAGDQLDWVVTAWIGAARNCIEQRLSGNLSGEPLEIGAFVVRWNLRGLGVPEQDIEAAIVTGTRVVALWDAQRSGEHRAPHFPVPRAVQRA
jgi:AcrR family transcriptional regulator